MLLGFGYMSFFSVLVGVAFGLLSSFLLKNCDFQFHPVREIFLILLFAYLSYIASEILGLSGIMTLFCCGFSMATYTFKNLSPSSKIGSVLAIETIGHAAEAFVFTYLGLSIFSIEQQYYNLPFTISLLLACMIARAAGVLIPALIIGVYNCFRLRINKKQLMLIWYSGTIRGAIAFALSL